HVAVGEVVQLTITASSDEQMSVGDIRLPPLQDFELLNSSTQSRQMIINGQVETAYSQIYLLQPTKSGKLVIPPVDVPINGQSYQTKQITITVGGKIGQKPQPQPQQQQRGQARPRGQQEDEEDDPFFDEADSLFQQLLKRHGLGGNAGGQHQANIN